MHSKCPGYQWISFSFQLRPSRSKVGCLGCLMVARYLMPCYVKKFIIWCLVDSTTSKAVWEGHLVFLCKLTKSSWWESSLFWLPSLGNLSLSLASLSFLQLRVFIGQNPIVFGHPTSSPIMVGLWILKTNPI